MNTTLSGPLLGMTCGNCVAKVQQRLAEHPDVTSAVVTLDPPQAELVSSSELRVDDLNAWLAPLGKYRLVDEKAAVVAPLPEKSTTTYMPLLILLGYLLAVTAGVVIAHDVWDGMLAMRWFMGGFFIAFSFFKMLDLRGFADVYRSYDIVAKAWPTYGFIYPFIELGLGLAYLANLFPWHVNLITAVVMGVSLIGVLQAVFSKRAIRCACLGTVFQLPMSTVTIVEDGLMLAMAIVMLSL